MGSAKIYGCVLRITSRASPVLGALLFRAIMHYGQRHHAPLDFAAAVFRAAVGSDPPGGGAEQLLVAFEFLAYGRRLSHPERHVALQVLFQGEGEMAQAIPWFLHTLRSMPGERIDNFIEALSPAAMAFMQADPAALLSQSLESLLANPHVHSGHDIFLAIDHLCSRSGITHADCAYAIEEFFRNKYAGHQPSRAEMRDMLRVCGVYLEGIPKNNHEISDCQRLFQSNLPLLLKAYLAVRLGAMSSPSSLVGLASFYHAMEQDLAAISHVKDTDQQAFMRDNIVNAIDVVYHYLQHRPDLGMISSHHNDELLASLLHFAVHHCGADRRARSLIGGLILTPGGPFIPSQAAIQMANKRIDYDLAAMGGICLVGANIAGSASDPYAPSLPFSQDLLVRWARQDFLLLPPEMRGIVLNTLACYAKSLVSNVASNQDKIDKKQYEQVILAFARELIAGIQRPSDLADLSRFVAVEHIDIGGIIDQRMAALKHMNDTDIKAVEQQQGVFQAIKTAIVSGHPDLVVNRVFSASSSSNHLIVRTAKALTHLAVGLLAAPYTISQRMSRSHQRYHTPGDALARSLQQDHPSEQLCVSHAQRSVASGMLALAVTALPRPRPKLRTLAAIPRPEQRALTEETADLNQVAAPSPDLSQTFVDHHASHQQGMGL